MTNTFRTQRGLDRIVNFSDATVAIAITLILLPLVDVASHTGPGQLGELFRTHRETLIAFFVSFVVIARMWTMHHRLFETVRSYSGALVRVNFLWLAGIAFLPFASNLLEVAGGSSVANALYVGVVAVCSLALAVMEAVVLRNPDLHSADAVRVLNPVNSWLTFVTLLLCSILTLIVPGSGVWWLLLLIPAGWISDLAARRRATPETTTCRTQTMKL